MTRQYHCIFKFDAHAEKSSIRIRCLTHKKDPAGLIEHKSLKE